MNGDTVTGIARKTRSDKGLPRNNRLDGFFDLFISMGVVEQRATIAVIEALHRRVQRGSMPAAPAEQEEIDGSEQA